MNKEEYSDYKVTIPLDKKRIVEDITKLAHLLAKQKVSVIISASSDEEAIKEAVLYLKRYSGIPETYMKIPQPRKMFISKNGIE